MLVVKNPPPSEGDISDVGSILGLGRSPGGEHGNPLQYCCLENPMDRGAWRAVDHRITKSWTQLKRLSTASVYIVYDYSLSLFFTIWCSDGKETACSAADLGLIPGPERSLGTGKGYPLQYSCLEIPWTEEPGGLHPVGSQRVRPTEQLTRPLFPHSSL